MNNILLQVATLFRNQSEVSILTIQKQNHQYFFSIDTQTNSDAKIVTLNCLREIIGTDKLKRICSNPCIDIDVSAIDQNSLTLTKNVVRRIFVGMLDFQVADLNEMDKKADIDAKFRHLLIYNKLEEVESLFMSSTPLLQKFKIDRATTSGKGFEGLVERIFIRIQHHFMVIQETDKKAAEIRDVELLTSRLADREMQKGELIHLSDGYFYVDHIFIGGGAYVSVLKDVQGINTPKIICRGTAMRRTATGGLKSGINDVLLEIGTLGVKSIWSDLSKYLIANQIKSVELLGKSLGGAFAQELALLIEGIDGIEIKKLTTFCSVGVGEAINNLFKTEILQKRAKPFELQVLRNGGSSQEQVDYIPTIGGVHLGEGSSPEQCKVEVYYIQPGDQEVGFFSLRSWFNLIRNFFLSFRYAHCRQTTLEKFSWKKVEDDRVQEHLNIGNRLEKIRKCFAYIIHFFTLCLLNGRSFASFFYVKRNEKRMRGSPANLPKTQIEKKIA